MKYFLDTNTCIFFLNGTHPKVRENIKGKSPADIKIPSLVKAELLYGALKSSKPEENTKKAELFLTPFEIVPFDDLAARTYAEIRFHTTKKGNTVGPNDLVIAATALSRSGKMVTNNTEEFGSIKSLEILDWSR